MTNIGSDVPMSPDDLMGALDTIRAAEQAFPAGAKATGQRKVQDGLFHEVLDRAFVAADSWERFIAQHPGLSKDPELKAAAIEIAARMADFYQMAGARLMNE